MKWQTRILLLAVVGELLLGTAVGFGVTKLARDGMVDKSEANLQLELAVKRACTTIPRAPAAERCIYAGFDDR